MTFDLVTGIHESSCLTLKSLRSGLPYTASSKVRGEKATTESISEQETRETNIRPNLPPTEPRGDRELWSERFRPEILRDLLFTCFWSRLLPFVDILPPESGWREGGEIDDETAKMIWNEIRKLPNWVNLLRSVFTGIRSTAYGRRQRYNKGSPIQEREQRQNFGRMSWLTHRSGEEGNDAVCVLSSWFEFWWQRNVIRARINSNFSSISLFFKDDHFEHFRRHCNCHRSIASVKMRSRIWVSGNRLVVQNRNVPSVSGSQKWVGQLQPRAYKDNTKNLSHFLTFTDMVDFSAKATASLTYCLPYVFNY